MAHGSVTKPAEHRGATSTGAAATSHKPIDGQDFGDVLAQFSSLADAWLQTSKLVAAQISSPHELLGPLRGLSGGHGQNLPHLLDIAFLSPKLGPELRALEAAGSSFAAAILTAGIANQLAGLSALQLKFGQDAQDPLKSGSSSGQNAPGPAAIPADAYKPGPRALALLRGLEIAKSDLALAGGAYTLAEVRAVLGQISRQRVDQLVNEGRLFTVPGPNNARCFPTLQFRDDRTLIDGLKEVQAALPTKNAWAILSFLVHPEPLLSGRTPIAALQAGEIEAVVTAASLLGEPGT